jgi:hypothetical protein
MIRPYVSPPDVYPPLRTLSLTVILPPPALALYKAATGDKGFRHIHHHYARARGLFVSVMRHWDRGVPVRLQGWGGGKDIHPRAVFHDPGDQFQSLQWHLVVNEPYERLRTDLRAIFGQMGVVNTVDKHLTMLVFYCETLIEARQIKAGVYAWYPARLDRIRRHPVRPAGAAPDAPRSAVPFQLWEEVAEMTPLENSKMVARLASSRHRIPPRGPVLLMVPCP